MPRWQMPPYQACTKEVTVRRLTARQRTLAEESMRFIPPGIAVFVRRNPDLRQAVRRVDLESVAMHAVCMAALTYDREKSQPTTYFGSAIRHALYRAVLRQKRMDERFVLLGGVGDASTAKSNRLERRASQALRLLSIADRLLLEDRLIDQVTLEQLAEELHCDPRTVSKRVQRAVETLRGIEKDLP